MVHLENMKTQHDSHEPDNSIAPNFEHLPVYERAERTTAAASPGSTLFPRGAEELTGSDLIVPINQDGRIDLHIGEGFSNICDPFFTGAPPEKTHSQDETLPSISSAVPPKMNILMLIVGSRGDVQPFVTLGQALQRDGHRVRIATHPHFHSFVEEHSLEFFDIGGNPAELMAYMVQNPGLTPKFTTLRQGEVHKRRQSMGDMIHASWRACFEPGSRPCEHRFNISSKKSAKSRDRQKDPMPFVADAIIANPPSLAHIHCAEKLGIPLHILFTMPWLPTRSFPHPLANIKNQSDNKGQFNYLSYLLVESIIWQGLGSIINRFRHRVLELDPIHPTRASTVLSGLRIPHTFCWSPSLLPKAEDWNPNVAVSGYLFDKYESSYTPPTSLQRFLEAGEPPLYIGFGSIVVDDPSALTNIVLEVVRRLGRRTILSAGWSSLGQKVGGASFVSSDIFILRQDCPHDWLFPQVSCVVHHGGAGTTAAGLRAGRPTVIVPFFGDQFFWGDNIYRAGAGPCPIPYRSLNVELLANAIQSAMCPEVLNCASRIRESISRENGVQNALQNIYASLSVNDMACALDKSRVAVWKSKSTGVQLSAVAATVLRKGGLVDWNDLESHRPMEHGVSKGPFEPVSGAAWAITELLYDSFRGMGEILIEVGNTPMACHGLLKDLSTSLKDKKVDAGVEEARSRVTMTEHVLVQNPVSEGSHTPQKNRKLPGEFMLTGTLRICKAAARAPGTFTTAMAEGAHNMPRMWGDSTVRPATRVTGVGSGVAEGCKELVLGVYDGISGLFVQPVSGLIKDGPMGFITGAGKGVLALPVKFFAAASGIVGFPLKGIDVAVSHAFKGDGTKAVRNQRMLQGEHEYTEISEQTRRDIVLRWQDVVATTQSKK